MFIFSAATFITTTPAAAAAGLLTASPSLQYLHEGLHNVTPRPQVDVSTGRK
jgi:hypothetical protein